MSKRNLFLHIGIHKTGTTSIQEFLTKNHLLLKHYDYLYPVVYQPEKNHNYFVWTFLDKRRSKLKKDLSWYHTVLLNEINSFPHIKNVILSAEAFCLLNEESIGKALSFFPDFNITIIVYFRRQDLFIESLYNEIIKNPESKYTKTFEDFEKKHLENLDYYGLCRKWAQYIPKDNIIIRPFEKGQFYKHDLIKDFLFSSGFTETKKLNFNIPVHNYAQSWRNIDFLRIFNGKSKLRGKARLMVLYGLRKIDHTVKRKRKGLLSFILFKCKRIFTKINPKKERLFSYPEIQEYIKRFKKDNRRIVDEFMKNRDTDLFTEHINKNIHVHKKTFMRKIINRISKPLIKNLITDMITLDKDIKDQYVLIDNLKQKYEETRIQKKSPGK